MSQKLPDGDYDIWENGADTGKDLNSSSDGNNVDTAGPPPWFGQWVETGHYDQHPGNETLEIYPTASSTIFEYKLKDADGNILHTGTLSKK